MTEEGNSLGSQSNVCSVRVVSRRPQHFIRDCETLSPLKAAHGIGEMQINEGFLIIWKIKKWGKLRSSIGGGIWGIPGEGGNTLVNALLCMRWEKQRGATKSRCKIKHSEPAAIFTCYVQRVIKGSNPCSFGS